MLKIQDTTKKTGKKVVATTLKTLRVRAMIGLSALFPTCTVSQELLDKVPGLKAKVQEVMSLRHNSAKKLEVSMFETTLHLL